MEVFLSGKVFHDDKQQRDHEPNNRDQAPANNDR